MFKNPVNLNFFQKQIFNRSAQVCVSTRQWKCETIFDVVAHATLSQEVLKALIHNGLQVIPLGRQREASTEGPLCVLCRIIFPLSFVSGPSCANTQPLVPSMLSFSSVF